VYGCVVIRETLLVHRDSSQSQTGAAGHDCATILIVEDDPVLCSTLAYNLSRDGFRVLTAGDGERGLAVAREELDRLDLVLLDVMLPGISGFHVLRMLRNETNIPILILSARGEVQDRIDGLELGADDYVTKPCRRAHRGRPYLLAPAKAGGRGLG
jgi:CheY-like chemotaxis protein